MLQAIVFDFDGVIVDSEPIHFRAFAELGRSIGYELDYPRYLRDFVGFDDRDGFRTMLEELGKPADDDRVAELCRRKQQIMLRLFEQGVPMIPGVRELIDQAHGHLPIAVASGATRMDIDTVLRGLGMTDRFEVIVTADDVARSKPDPQTYTLAVEQLAARHPDLGLRPGTCLAIEDTPFGIASARAAGLMTLGLATTGPADRLFDAHRVVDHLQAVDLDTLHHWFDDVPPA